MRKRKHKRTSSRKSSKRRGVSGLPSGKQMQSTLMEVAGSVGGAVASSFITNTLLKDKFVDKPLLKALIPVAAGTVIAGMMKSPILKAVGVGMATQGGLLVAKQLIPGIGAITDGDIAGIEQDIQIGDTSQDDGMITIGDLDGVDGVEDYA